jgi:hypothetical protein
MPPWGPDLENNNKVCAAVLLLWVMEAMFNRILFCCNGHQGTVLRFVEIVKITSWCPMQENNMYVIR